MRKKDTVIVIGAHPDDIEIGCGGTIKRLSEDNCELYYLVATLGEKCIVNGYEKSELHEIRKEESHNAAKYMGVKEIFYLGLNDTQIEHNGITVSAIEKYVNKLKPRTIITHTKQDYHQDHQNLALSTVSACRRAKINILHYESPSTALTFLPVAFNDITDTIEHKIEALGYFSSQNEKKYLDTEAIKGLARYRGYTSGYEFAEAFEMSKYYIES